MEIARAIALDVGDSRIGVAISDGLGFTAQGIGVIKRTNLNKDLEQIKKYILDYNAKLIVVGNPINLDGTTGPRAIITQEFFNKLDVINIEKILWDERLSTNQAQRALDEAGVNWRKKREVIDMMAAQIILQSYIDYKNLKGEKII